MGYWQTERGLGGDSWADILDGCMKQLSEARINGQSKLYGDLHEYEITMKEFADLIEFCSRGHLIVEVRHPETDGSRPLSELHSNGVDTYGNRGQIHCAPESDSELVGVQSN